MAVNKPYGDGHRQGMVRDRFQTHNPVTDRWAVHDADTGRILRVKADADPYKGIRKDR